MMMGRLLECCCGRVGYPTGIMLWFCLVPYWHDGHVYFGLFWYGYVGCPKVMIGIHAESFFCMKPGLKVHILFLLFC